MTNFFQNKKILITGGNGFLGSQIRERLLPRSGAIVTPHRSEVDFTRQAATEKYLAEQKFDIIIHCAAFYGGMAIHEKFPGNIYYENLMMSTNLIEAARVNKVAKFVIIGSDCAYPGYLNKDILVEEDFWTGPPHETALDYGIVKRILSVQSWAYKKQYGFHSIFLIPTNMYGPGDNFDFGSSHVVGALIRRFVEAKMDKMPFVEVWGTGAPTRNFLYVEDAANGIVLATEKYDDGAPMNLTTTNGCSVRELAEMIREVVVYQGEITWNTSKPDGQLKKILDVTKMKTKLGWEPRQTLRDGLQKTVTWYLAHKIEADRKKKVLYDQTLGNNSGVV